MKRPIVVILISVILVSIQASVAYDLIRSFTTSKPDMLLIFVAFLAFRYGLFEGIVYGFFIGFSQDIVSGGILGINSLIFLNIGLCVGYFSNKIYSKSLSAGIILTSIALVIKTILLIFVSMIYLDFDNVVHLFKSELLIGLPLTILLASPMFIILEKLSPIIFDTNRVNLGKNISNSHNDD